MKISIFAFLPYYWATVGVVVVAQDEQLCPCKFDGNDSSDCRVYGQLGDDVLIPWYLASQDCLDAHNIKISAVDSTTLANMCDPPNPNSFVNYLKFESTEASTSIKQSYGQFWNGDANPVTLVSTINGVDCEQDESGCWNEIKAYFEANPEEIQDNCQTFYNNAAKDLELEQSTVRISICNAEITADCGDLSTQVNETKAANPDKACSAFGLGPVSGGPEQPPVCGDDSTSGSREINTTTTGSTSSGANQWKSLFNALVLAVSVAFLF